MSIETGSPADVVGPVMTRRDAGNIMRRLRTQYNDQQKKDFLGKGFGDIATTVTREGMQPIEQTIDVLYANAYQIGRSKTAPTASPAEILEKGLQQLGIKPREFVGIAIGAAALSTLAGCNGKASGITSERADYAIGGLTTIVNMAEKYGYHDVAAIGPVTKLDRIVGNSWRAGKPEHRDLQQRMRNLDGAKKRPKQLFGGLRGRSAKLVPAT